MNPVIGITPGPREETRPHGAFTYWELNSDYTSAIEAAGGVPVILPPQGDPGRVLDVLDGVLLSGGADLDPAHYGDPDVHPTTYGIDPRRDGFELELMRLAFERDIPVLGICRGIQVMNVALGGSLIQDVSTGREDIPGINHRQHETGLTADAVGHVAMLLDHPASRHIGDPGQVGVNTFHHQAVRRLAPSLEAIAYSPDGLVEAVSAPGKSFVLGLQWHPEMMFATHPEHLRPFASLVEAARQRRLSGVS